MMELYAKIDLEKILDCFNPEYVEEQKPQPIVKTKDLGKIIKLYEQALHNSRGKMSELKSLITVHGQQVRLEQAIMPEILHPQEINLFLKHTMSYEDHQDYAMITGIFLTRLLERSYQGGFNNFEIYLPDQALMYLGLELKAAEQQPLKVTFKGKVGQECGSGSWNVFYHFLDEVGDSLGPKAKGCLFYGEKNIGNGCGGYDSGIMLSSFPLVGARRSHFILKEKVDSFFLMTEYCTFWVYDPDTLEKAKQEIRSKNRIVYVHDDEKKIVRDY